MNWKIEFNINAVKDFKKLDKSVQALIRKYLRIKVLGASHPTDLGKPLKHGLVGLWRYRVEKYRVICKIENDALVVLVIKIAKRDDVYN